MIHNAQQQYKRVKFIINHFSNRFYEEYILALREGINMTFETLIIRANSVWMMWF